MAIPDENSKSHLRERDSENQPETIVLYSPDLDLCVSLRMCFQDRYRLITTTDIEMLSTIVRTFQPALVVADASPTERMRQRFNAMKREKPGLRVMMLYASRFSERSARDYMLTSVDALFSKPLDLEEVTRSIHELVRLSEASE